MSSSTYIQDKLQELFGLSFPVSRILLTSRFRELAKVHHPDMGGTEGKFKELYEAYQELLSYVSEDTQFFEMERATDGRLLVDLGKGLGRVTNGVSCRRCEGEGYYQVTLYREVVGESSICRCRKVRCRRCNSGKFTLRSGRVVDCLTCKGSGIFILQFSSRRAGFFKFCPWCFGLGVTRMTQVPFQRYESCGECEGSGEIRLMNPVLQRGALKL